MSFRRIVPILFVLVLSFPPARADKKSPATQPGKPQPISSQGRFDIIRGINAELVYVRKPFPMGEKGLVLTPEGKLTPEDQDLARLMANYGPAAHPGDRVRITDVIIKGNSIRLEINGGPKKKKKWYEHVQVSGMGGTMSPTSPDSKVNPRGSSLTLVFPDYVPEMSVDQLKKWLAPVFDFSSLSATQAYLDTIPPKAKEAIKNHQVLVGMDRQMVTTALGRPPKKYRDKDDQGREYEEWIYGEPPADVQFVRFAGDEVVRLEIMKVGGEKQVRTEKEVDVKQAAAQKPQGPASRPAKVPSLQRPGEEPEPGSTPKSVALPSDQEPVDPNKRDPTMGPPKPIPNPQPPPVVAPPNAPPGAPGQQDPTTTPQ